jgi:dihydroflavonol-4-reductase
MHPSPSFWADRPVCVTGGTGFLGGHLVRQLVGLGARVRSFALPARPGHPLLAERRVERIEGDLLDSHAVRRAVAGCSVVFHTAGLVATCGPALKKMHAVHVEGTAHVLAALGSSARIIHTSSLVAVGASRDGQPVTEDQVFNLGRLRVAYVRAKRSAEEVALGDPGRDVVVVNPSYLVGPDDHDLSVMGRLCQRYWSGRLPVAPPGGLNFVDVRDAARGHLLAAEHGVRGRRYLLGGEDRLLRDFMGLLAAAARWQPRALPVLPGWMLQALAVGATARAWLTRREPFPSCEDARTLAWFWYCRSDRARDELGYRSRPLTETVTDTFRWYRAIHEQTPRGMRQWWLRAG